MGRRKPAGARVVACFVRDLSPLRALLLRRHGLKQAGAIGRQAASLGQPRSLFWAGGAYGQQKATGCWQERMQGPDDLDSG